MAGRATHADPIGVTIAAVAAGAWTVWGASGLHHVVALVVRVAGVALAGVILAHALHSRRRATGVQPLMFATRTYRVVVAVEVVALAAGVVVLSSADRSEYVVCWTAAVVGLHFLLFGRLFAPRFYLPGTALLLAAGLGVVVGAGGGGRDHVTATVGLIAAASLLVTAGATLTGRSRSLR